MLKNIYAIRITRLVVWCGFIASVLSPSTWADEQLLDILDNTTLVGPEGSIQRVYSNARDLVVDDHSVLRLRDNRQILFLAGEKLIELSVTYSDGWSSILNISVTDTRTQEKSLLQLFLDDYVWVDRGGTVWGKTKLSAKKGHRYGYPTFWAKVWQVSEENDEPAKLLFEDFLDKLSAAVEKGDANDTTKLLASDLEHAYPQRVVSIGTEQLVHQTNHFMVNGVPFVVANYHRWRGIDNCFYLDRVVFYGFEIVFRGRTSRDLGYGDSYHPESRKRFLQVKRVVYDPAIDPFHEFPAKLKIDRGRNGKVSAIVLPTGEKFSYAIDENGQAASRLYQARPGGEVTAISAEEHLDRLTTSSQGVPNIRESLEEFFFNRLPEVLEDRDIFDSHVARLQRRHNISTDEEFGYAYYFLSALNLWGSFNMTSEDTLQSEVFQDTFGLPMPKDDEAAIAFAVEMFKADKATGQTNLGDLIDRIITAAEADILAHQQRAIEAAGKILAPLPPVDEHSPAYPVLSEIIEGIALTDPGVGDSLRAMLRGEPGVGRFVLIEDSRDLQSIAATKLDVSKALLFVIKGGEPPHNIYLANEGLQDLEQGAARSREIADANNANKSYTHTYFGDPSFQMDQLVSDFDFRKLVLVHEQGHLLEPAQGTDNVDLGATNVLSRLNKLGGDPAYYFLVGVDPILNQLGVYLTYEVLPRFHREALANYYALNVLAPSL